MVELGTINNEQDEAKFDYQLTLMYGRYTRDLGEFAKDEAKRIKLLEKDRKSYEKEKTKELRIYRGKNATRCLAFINMLWRNTFARLGEDWVYLATLGIIMALLSFIMDRGISMCNQARIWLYRDLATHPLLQYLAWICFPVFLVLFSAGFSHIVAPQAIGSGIPEMKTIMRGVVLKEYLTFRTLVGKVVGLTASLGSGLPLGKEGPFVHIGSLVATALSKVFTLFKGISDSESRSTEMLAAAAAVGVASCFASPVGGVLFSIEVTSVYFAVRNYWRGFFGSVCGATVFRLLAVWFNDEETVTAVFRTHFPSDFPYDPQELCVYAIMGVASGLGGALFVLAHRKYVLFMRKNKKMNYFLQKNRFIYPGCVALLISSLTFPLGLGQFMAADLTTHSQVEQLFSNFTWAQKHHAVDENEILSHWATPHSNIFITLSVYSLMTFLMTIVAVTLPVPCGLFIPVFKVGAGLGRLTGECMALWFPDGIRYHGVNNPIVPGGYAIAGAAAFSGAVTHTISVAVIVFEMTGQIVHCVPVMIAVLIANAVAQPLQPSIYDSIIQIKKLPFLPDILSSKTGAYNIFVEDFMVRDVKFVWHGMNYRDLRRVLRESKKIRTLPLVDTEESMILLGSIQRHELVILVEKHLGKERRMQAAVKWHLAAKRMMEAKNKQDGKMSRSASEEKISTTPVRKLSRFEITPVIVPAKDMIDAAQEVKLEKKRMRRNSSLDNISNCLQPLSPTSPYASLPAPGIENDKKRPIKSILKKTESFQLPRTSSSNNPTPLGTPYATVTSGESRLRVALDTIFRKSGSLRSSKGDLTFGDTSSSGKRVTLPRERVIDMSPEDQRLWEEQEMEKIVDLSVCHIDPAPFQLVERTSLLKVHSLFSMLSLNHAYVTAIGKLMGVVALTELRQAIEGVNSGSLPVASHIDHETESEGDVEAPPLINNDPLKEGDDKTPPRATFTIEPPEDTEKRNGKAGTKED